MAHHSELAELLRRAADSLEDMEQATTPPEPTHGPELRRLFPYPDAATYLGCSQRKVQALTASGEIPKVMIGSRVLLAREHLDAYIDRQRDLA